MRIIDMEATEKFRSGLVLQAAGTKPPAKKKAAEKTASKSAVKAPGSRAAVPAGAKVPQQQMPVTPGTGAAQKSGGKAAGKPGGKSPISSTHQKLHRIAQTHGFQHAGMSVYQHPQMNLTLSVGPQGWSLSDGTTGTDYEDLMTHLQKSFGLQMQDPNAVDPMTGQPMGAQPQQPQRRPAPGGGGAGAGARPGQPRQQKNPNGFQQSFMGR